MQLVRFVIEVLIADAVSGSSSPTGLIEIAKVIIGALGPVIAALIVGIAGALITSHYARERERIESEAVDNRHQKDLLALQKRHDLDKESEWRSHAVELTKLEFERKLEAWKADHSPKKDPLRPVILDFLATYRDLSELDRVTPKDLYGIIKAGRISRTPKVIENAPAGAQQASAKPTLDAATENPEIKAAAPEVGSIKHVDSLLPADDSTHTPTESKPSTPGIHDKD